MTDFSWKKYQFITEVQTAILANALNVAVHDKNAQRRADYSGSGVMICMDDAFFAADRIPEDLSAHEAASDFYAACVEGEDYPYWAQRV